MIKMVIFDGDGTLEFPSPSPAIHELLSYMRLTGIKIGVATNQSSEQQVRRKFQIAGLPEPDCVATPQEIGKRKPAPDFVRHLQKAAGVQLNEIIFLGDDDTTDAFCAINANVLPARAAYSRSASNMKYGLPFLSPQSFHKYLNTFGSQTEPYFGWVYSNDAQKIDSRALICDQGEIKTEIREVLKNSVNVTIGPNKTPLAAILIYYLVSQGFLSGTFQEVDWITVFPGHQCGSKGSAVLRQNMPLVASLFRDSFIDDLLIRHQDAPKSQYQGDNRNIYDQFRTLHVNGLYGPRLTGKRVLILDDFATAGFSLETARQMLLKAGASKVITLAIAKFRIATATSLIKGQWDSYSPFVLPSDVISTSQVYGTVHNNADRYFYDTILRAYRS